MENHEIFKLRLWEICLAVIKDQIYSAAVLLKTNQTSDPGILTSATCTDSRARAQCTLMNRQTNPSQQNTFSIPVQTEWQEHSSVIVFT